MNIWVVKSKYGYLEAVYDSSIEYETLEKFYGEGFVIFLEPVLKNTNAA